MSSTPPSLKIGLFYGGRLKDYFERMRDMAPTFGAELTLIRFEEVHYDSSQKGSPIRVGRNGLTPNDFDVLYFRLIGSHSEVVDLVVDSITRSGVHVIDPLLKGCGRFRTCKAFQMQSFSRAGKLIVFFSFA